MPPVMQEGLILVASSDKNDYGKGGRRLAK